LKRLVSMNTIRCAVARRCLDRTVRARGAFRHTGDRGFESVSLQRGVRKVSVPACSGRVGCELDASRFVTHPPWVAPAYDNMANSLRRAASALVAAVPMSLETEAFRCQL
jgi:hypothetical protein